MYHRSEWLAVVFCIGMLFGTLLGCHIGITQMRTEAINHNTAYWTVDKEGVTTFNWKTSIEKQAQQ
jgi:hypothetical protein